jgi:hypothetical protein
VYTPETAWGWGENYERIQMAYGYMKQDQAMAVKETFERNRTKGRARARTIKLKDQNPVKVRFAEGDELAALREGAAMRPGVNIDRRQRYYRFKDRPGNEVAPVAEGH